MSNVEQVERLDDYELVDMLDSSSLSSCNAKSDKIDYDGENISSILYLTQIKYKIKFFKQKLIETLMKNDKYLKFELNNEKEKSLSHSLAAHSFLIGDHNEKQFSVKIKSEPTVFSSVKFLEEDPEIFNFASMCVDEATNFLNKTESVKESNASEWSGVSDKWSSCEFNLVLDSYKYPYYLFEYNPRLFEKLKEELASSFKARL